MKGRLIITETDGRGVATLTLNRSEVNNAYNRELLEAIQAALAEHSGDDAVRCLVFRGSGKHFQAGADYVGSLAKAHSARRQSEEAAEGFRSFIEKRKPAWYPE